MCEEKRKEICEKIIRTWLDDFTKCVGFKIDTLLKLLEMNSLSVGDTDIREIVSSAVCSESEDGGITEKIIPAVSDVRIAFAELEKERGGAATAAVLRKYGAQGIRDIEVSDFPAVLKDLEDMRYEPC